MTIGYAITVAMMGTVLIICSPFVLVAAPFVLAADMLDDIKAERKNKE